MRVTGSALLAVFAANLVIAALAPATLGQEPSAAAGRSGQSEASLAPGSAILAELNSSVDSKKVKAGDPIVAHITQATARGKGGEESALGIQFDKAVLKEGGEISLNVVIQALAAPMT